MSKEGEESALRELLRFLKSSAYRFVTTTPETHARLLRRDPHTARDLRDIFGWSRAFDDALLPTALFTVLRDADFMEETAGGWKSRVRVASVDEDLFVHSSFPATGSEAVFFGPDSYRFVRLLKAELAGGAFARRGLRGRRRGRRDHPGAHGPN
jgi:hypothetical protein